MMSVYVLYELDKPDEYKYVGITSLPLEQRLRDHIGRSYHKAVTRYALYRWIRSLRQDYGKYPIGIKLLDSVEYADAHRLERAYIRGLSKSGHRLFNIYGNV